MNWLVQLIVPIFICVVLPVSIIWIIYRNATNRDNRNAAIIMKAIETDSDIDTDKLVEALGKQRKTDRQIAMLRLLRGCIFTLIGLTTAGLAIVTGIMNEDMEDAFDLFVVSGICLSVGIAYLIVYFVSRKQLVAENTEQIAE